MVRGRTRRDLDTDRMFQLALTRLIEILGEAANRVTAAGVARYTEIPWPKIVSTRNRIIHQYDAVNYDVRQDGHRVGQDPGDGHGCRLAHPQPGGDSAGRPILEACA